MSKNIRYGGGRDKRPYLKPVQKIELNEKRFGPRLALVIILIVIAVGAFVYGIMNLLSNSQPGMQKIDINSHEESNCSSEFVFYYYLGDSGIAHSIEYKKISALYTDLCVNAYRVFSPGEEFETVNNLCYINKHPNETIEVDPLLYSAIEKLVKSSCRDIFLAPVYSAYANVYGSDNDYLAKDSDPYYNEELANYVDELCEFTADEKSISIELFGDNKLRLNVSEDYMNYAQAEEITEYLDFFWMKNAFIIDYIADELAANGYFKGSLSSYDGFIRNLDKSGNEYNFNLFDRKEHVVTLAASMKYNTEMSIVFMRDFPVVDLDSFRYYIYGNGETRTPYINMNGKCINSLSTLVCFSPEKGCADILLEMKDIYISSELDRSEVSKIKNDGIYSIWFEDLNIISNSEDVEIINIAQGYSAQTLLLSF